MSYYDTKISEEPKEWTVSYGNRKYKIMARCQIEAMKTGDRLLQEDIEKEKKEKFDKTVLGRIYKFMGF